MAETIAITLADVSCGYRRGVPIVIDVSIDFHGRSITTIVGPNGAGKSTLLKGIYGLTPWTKGSITVPDGTSIESLPSWERLKRGVAIVPQGRCNFPFLSVLENLQLGAYSVERPLVGERIGGVIDRFPVLKEHLHRPAGNLSGGQQQILELAMAMVTRPLVLLVDEPSLGLSPAAQTTVFDALREIADSGVCVVMIEQNVRAGLSSADYGVVMSLGRVVKVGGADAILGDADMRDIFLGADIRKS